MGYVGWSGVSNLANTTAGGAVSTVAIVASTVAAGQGVGDSGAVDLYNGAAWDPLLLSYEPTLLLDFLAAPTKTYGEYEADTLGLNFINETYQIEAVNDPAYGYGLYLVAG